ncbi:MAG: TauD/TfdA family dioxygenase [Novosphingobium sp.]|nr:TauD/TfdA family dioxygenase [Novosphingobium sp.]
MARLKVRNLSDERTFGARILGVDAQSVKDEAVRQELRDVFDDRGMIVFEGMEPSDAMQVALSEVFGPGQDHAMPGVPRVDRDGIPGMIRIAAEPVDTTIFEIDGEQVAGKVSWHFDACYTEKLNRGGILRILTIPGEGGMTGFADGVQMYEALSAEWRAKAEALEVVYSQELMLHRQRFGMPENFRLVSLQSEAEALFELVRGTKRAIHPAVWQRKTGENVLHVSPWQAAGLAGRENADGDALLESLIQEMFSVMDPYWHAWKPDEMVTWDNWRFLHAVSGHPPQYARAVHRTTIKGDYGFGRFEDDPVGDNAVPA